jgi:TrmH family RNA methyltransferase
MLRDEQRARVAVILVRARNPNNIGAVARAMHGFGFLDLRLVSDYPIALEDARSAVDASEILASAQTFATVADAIRGCRLVVGTTAVGERRREHRLETPASGAASIVAALSSGTVALLFGSEKTGLNNEELSFCDWLMTVPMHPTPGMRHASMNLGQAVAVCLYELIRDTPLAFEVPASPAAQAQDLERVTALLREVLLLSGYADHRASFAEPAFLRRTIHRLQLGQSDARRWIGVLRRILWKLNA